ncbi:hypothetical protein B0H11DRAFT_2004408 [Mycena galericulata]|nr:hypothetical protein B0H11DRAFT_2004408 [Mycena galericulata]
MSLFHRPARYCLSFFLSPISRTASYLCTTYLPCDYVKPHDLSIHPNLAHNVQHMLVVAADDELYMMKNMY